MNFEFFYNLFIISFWIICGIANYGWTLAFARNAFTDPDNYAKYGLSGTEVPMPLHFQYAVAVVSSLGGFIGLLSTSIASIAIMKRSVWAYGWIWK